MMEDWKEAYCGQSNPHNLKKISANLDDFRKILKPEHTFLDVGCHMGHVYDYLGRPEKYKGIDLSAALVKQARHDYPGADFEAKNLYGLEGSWDVILCCRVLMHLPDFEGAVEKLKSCARKYLVLVIPIGADAVNVENDRTTKKSYFRTFSRQTILKTGATEIIKHEPYSTIIYKKESSD